VKLSNFIRYLTYGTDAQESWQAAATALQVVTASLSEIF
jgi:hypothetical protein